MAAASRARGRSRWSMRRSSTTPFPVPQASAPGSTCPPAVRPGCTTRSWPRTQPAPARLLPQATSPWPAAATSFPNSQFNLIGTGGSGGLSSGGITSNVVGIANPGLAPALATSGGITQTLALVAGQPRHRRRLRHDRRRERAEHRPARGAARSRRAQRRINGGHRGLRSQLVVPGYKHGRHVRHRYARDGRRLGQRQYQRQPRQHRQPCSQHDRLRPDRPLLHTTNDRFDGQHRSSSPTRPSPRRLSARSRARSPSAAATPRLLTVAAGVTASITGAHDRRRYRQPRRRRR